MLHGMSRIPALAKLFEATPDDVDLPYMIALEHAKQGASEEALVWLDKAIAINASHHYAWYQKARLLGGLGEDTAAREAAEAGLKQAQADSAEKAASELQELLGSL